MLYIIPANDHAAINAIMPAGHSFGYADEYGRYIFDTYSRGFFTFDIDITLTEAIGKTYDQYIETLQPLSQYYCKVYRYLTDETRTAYDPLKAPVDLDYKTGLTRNLHSKHTFFKGELRKTDYFADQTQTDKVLTVEMVYQRDALGFATTRTVTRKWVMENGEYHPTIKTTVKDYTLNVINQIREGITRRENLINNVQTPTLAFMLATITGKSQAEVILMGRAFMDTMEDTMQKFIKNSSTVTDAANPDFGKKTLWVTFRDAPETWLDNKPPQLGGTMSIRQYLMNEVDI